MDRFVIISGCSGGGKSALIEELAGRGFSVVEEPGRRIVAEERAGSGTALPWVDAALFARRAVEMARADRQAAEQQSGWVFFDRGLIDAAAALEHVTDEPALEPLKASQRYHRRVFLAPPWSEIYATDADRRHDIDEAVAEYERLLTAYPALDYEVMILPKINVEQRADFILQALAPD